MNIWKIQVNCGILIQYVEEFQCLNIVFHPGKLITFEIITNLEILFKHLYW
jgi:hypothetical protein